MAQKTGFSIQLDDIPNPVTYEQAGAKIEKAGVYEGQAKVAEAQAIGGLVADAAAIGAETYKQYGKSQIKKESEELWKNYEDHPENVAGRRAAATVEQFDRERDDFVFASHVDAPAPTQEPAEITAMRTEAAKHKQREAQGFATKEETLTRIADVVKRWSARTPGYASDFRKAAADVTGISAIDVYQVHQALTTQSNREKAALKLQEQAMKYNMDVAEWHGISPETVTSQHRERYTYFKQLEGTQKVVEAQGKIDAASANKRGQSLDGLVSLQNSQNIVKLTGLFAEYDKANLDPNATKARDDISRAINVELTNMHTQSLALVEEMARKWDLPGSIISAKKQSINDDFKVYTTLMQTKGGTDSMRVLLGRKQDAVKDQVSTFELMHPLFKVYADAGYGRDSLAMYHEMGKDGFAKKFGKQMADEYESVVKGAAAWAPKYKRIIDPKSYDMFGPINFNNPTERAYWQNPAEMRVASNQLRDAATRVAVLKDATPQEQVVGLNSIHAINTNVKNDTGIDAKFLRDTVDIANTPGMEQLLAKTPVAVRNTISEPLFEALKQPTHEAMSRAASLIDTINMDSRNRLYGMGWQIGVAQGMDGKLEVRWTQTGQPAPGSMEGETAPYIEGTAVRGIRPAPATGWQGQAAMDAEKELKKTVADLNQYGAGLAAGWFQRGADQPELGTPNGIYGLISDGIKTGVAPALTPQARFEQAAEVRGDVKARQRVPEAQRYQAPLDIHHVPTTLALTEGGYINPGRSEADALGKYQLRPDAVRDVLKKWGMQVDESKMDWYRTDHKMSTKIANEFFMMNYKRFGGDIELAAAAYNAGPTRVEKAVKLATEAGKPDAWADYMTGKHGSQSAENNKRMRDYVARFVRNYSQYEPGKIDPVTGQKLSAGEQPLVLAQATPQRPLTPEERLLQGGGNAVGGFSLFPTKPPAPKTPEQIKKEEEDRKRPKGNMGVRGEVGGTEIV